MKYIFTFCLLIPSILFAQATLEDFEENRNISYGFKHGEFDPGLVAAVVQPYSNPYTSGANPSEYCGLYTKNPNPNDSIDVIVFNPYANFEDISDYVDGTKQITLDVWSSTPSTTVQITFENSNMAEPDNFPVGRHSVFEATTTVSSAWETLTFSLIALPDSLVPDAGLDQGVLVFNPSVLEYASFYYDNLVGPSNDCIDASPMQNVYDDFECQRNLDYTFTHGALSLIPNPDQSGVNTSSRVGQYVRSDWSASDVVYFDFDAPIVFDANEVISIKIWSQYSKDVKLALQDEDGVDGFSVDQTISLPGNSQWQEFEFNFGSSIPSNVDIVKGVLLFAPGETGAPYTFYYDDLQKKETTSVSEYQSLNLKISNNKLFLGEFEGLKNVKVYDFAGRLLSEQSTSENELTINNSGLLLIHVIDENGNSSSIKYYQNL